MMMLLLLLLLLMMMMMMTLPLSPSQDDGGLVHKTVSLFLCSMGVR
jgi:hypothetical protein